MPDETLRQWKCDDPEGAGRGFNLGVGLTKPVATVTLWHCLVNTACAILTVFTATHFVSCTIQSEETGFHLLSTPVFEEAVGAVGHACCVTPVCKSRDGGMLSWDSSVCPFAVVILAHVTPEDKICPQTA